jgi:hypothetical protein
MVSVTAGPQHELPIWTGEAGAGPQQEPDGFSIA